MRIVVFGAGAIGSVLGAILARTHDVVLIGRGAHVQEIRRRGLQVEGLEPSPIRIEARADVKGLAAPDLVLLTVKTYDVDAALETVAGLVGPRTIVVAAQNGLGSYEAAKGRLPTCTVLGASVVIGAAMMGPGHVRRSSEGEIVVGGEPSDANAVEQSVAAFNQAGLRARSTDNLQGTLWLKAIANAAINPLTAIHRVPNGRLVEDATLRASLERATKEAERVARAEGVTLPVPDAWAFVRDIATKTGSNRSSMLQSVERGQRTEIDAITGRILEAAKRHGLACPENERLYEAVKHLEASTAR